MQKILSDMSLSAVVAGFIAVLIGYASSAVLIFQAAQAADLSILQTASWLASASLGCGLLSLFLSYRLKVPFITAWSTPGAALLITSLPLYAYDQAIGAYLFSAVLVVVFGITGLFSKLINKIPMSIIAGMLAGILLQFCLQMFLQIQFEPLLVLSMCGVYFLAKLILPRYAIVMTLLTGLLVVFLFQQISIQAVDWNITGVQWQTPSFSFAAMIGVGLPLFIVAMTSQNASGLAVLKTSHYQVPESKLITHTGLMSIWTAPFGSHGVTISSITAAICTSADCHADLKKRYIAGISCGLFYIVFALFAESMVQLFALLPKAFIIAIAGLALFSACSNALKAAFLQPEHLDAAMLSFMVTASGLTLWGIGSAFWGLIAGLFFYLLKHIFQSKFKLGSL